MSKPKDQQAQEYVLNRQTARHNAKSEEDATMTDFDKTRKVWDAYDMEQAYLDGYTACEQSMWRSVVDEMPEDGQAIIIRVVQKEAKSGKMFESCFNTFYFKQYGFDIEERQHRGKISKVTHWMPKPDLPIPSLPDTNTEKK